MKYAVRILVTVTLCAVAGASSALAQSTDIDNPTPMVAALVEGEGDGKGETVYYSFDALKGDVKITVDAKTDYYSTPVQVTLLDEDGKELLPIYVVAKGPGQREIKTRRFVRDQKVIVRITTRDDKEVKLLNYKVKVEGSVQFAAPAVVESGEQVQPVPTESTSTAATPQSSSPSPESGEPEKKGLKKKAKEAAKDAAKKIIDN